MNPRFVVAALCLLGPLTCVAHGVNINGEATYVSFSVPGALGTYPTGINASMEVTGYYNTPSTQRGFLREANGAITTFAVEGAFFTVPEGINAAGDITGYYNKPLVYTQLGFLRYADGRIITFDTNQTNGELGFSPVGINDFDEIAGNLVYHGYSAVTRSRAGVISSLALGPPGGPVGTATALNASGSVVGYYGNPDSLFTGFVVHPDGYWAEIQLPGDPGPGCSNQIFPDAINAAGTIAGFFTKNYFFAPSCGSNTTGGFVVSPGGELTLFEAPGPIPLFDDHTQDEFLMTPHWINIDQAGDIAGSYIGINDEDYHGFVRNPYGTITSFDPPEGAQTHVTGINDAGAIAGYYSYHYMGGFQLPVGFIRIPQ